MKLWKFFFQLKLRNYINALSHPRSTINFYQQYSSEFKKRVKRISLLLDVSEEKINSIIEEINDDGFYDNIKKELDRYSELYLGHSLNPLGAPTLYILARIFKPSVLVETGVSSGVSSAFTLKALSKNNKGKLFSIDLPNQDPSGKAIVPKGEKSGWAIPNNLRERHELIIGDSKKELPKLLEKLGTIDWFFHDSLHTYEFMMWEYDQAWNHLKTPGLLLSDDITWNMAFNDFIKNVDARIWATFYNVGVIKKG